MTEQKKTYTQPTLTQYGTVETRTTGIEGDSWEWYGTRYVTQPY
jgi:hypothetical protein